MNISIDDKNRLERKGSLESIVGQAPIDSPVSAAPMVQDIQCSADQEPSEPPYSSDNPRLSKSLGKTPPSSEGNMWLSGSSAGSAAAVLQAIRALINTSIEGSIILMPLTVQLLKMANECGVEMAKLAQKEHEKEAEKMRMQAYQEIGSAVTAGVQIVASVRAEGAAQGEAEKKETGAELTDPQNPQGLKIKETLGMKKAEALKKLNASEAAYNTSGKLAGSPQEIAYNTDKTAYDNIENRIATEKRSMLEGSRQSITQLGQIVTSSIGAYIHSATANIETEKGKISLEKGLQEALQNLIRKWEDMLHESRQKSGDIVRSQVDIFSNLSSSFAHMSNPRG